MEREREKMALNSTAVIVCLVILTTHVFSFSSLSHTFLLHSSSRGKMFSAYGGSCADLSLHFVTFFGHSDIASLYLSSFVELYRPAR